MLLTLLMKIRLSSNRLKHFSLVLMVLVVTACGQMGPLYLPVDETATSDTSNLSSTTEF
ncbi:MAG: lipoprotein [Pseudomonadota bacterium]|nr:lipoprotein [Pseudomonadota bacterium]